ncbi:MAG: hypothetical protein R3281_11965 [Balneolaceae bacterium]|nr:hypothetical protein [Balneolaceae bacterium]
MGKQTPYLCSSIFGTLLGLAFITGSAGSAQSQQVTYNGSLQFAAGSYFFDESTSSFSLSNGLGWSGDRTSVSISLPYIIQNSPWITYGAAGSLPTGGPQHGALRDSTGNRPGQGGGGMHGNGNGSGRNKAVLDNPVPVLQRKNSIPIPDTSTYAESSFGDPNIYASFRIYDTPAGDTRVLLNSGLKIPFADPSNGFGTGEWDVGLGISGTRRINHYLVYLNLMKWWFGDLPDLELKNPVSYGIGISRSIADGKAMVNSTLNGYTEIIEDYDPPVTLSVGIGYFASERLSLNGSLSAGLSESSADFYMGMGWSLKL